MDNVYIVVDKTTFNAYAFKSKIQVAKFIGVNKNTLRTIPYSNKKYNVVVSDVTPNKHKGRKL